MSLALWTFCLRFLDLQLSLQQPKQEWSGPSQSGDSGDIEQWQTQDALHQGHLSAFSFLELPPLCLLPLPCCRITFAMETVNFGKCSRRTEFPGPTGSLYDLLTMESQPHPPQLKAAGVSCVSSCPVTAPPVFVIQSLVLKEEKMSRVKGDPNDERKAG